MKAMIFAAGLGTRLKPLTDTMPKALVPICGKPLLEHVVTKLTKAGFDDLVVNVHHFAGQIEDWCRLNAPNIHISDERSSLLETGGGIRKVAHLLKVNNKEDRFLIHNVDILSNVDLQSFWKAGAEAKATLLVSERDTQRYLIFDSTMRLVGWTNIKTGEVKSPYPAVHEAFTENYIAPVDAYNVLSSPFMRPTGTGPYKLLAFSGIHQMHTSLINEMDGWLDRFSIIDFYLSICDKVRIQGYVQPDLTLLDVGKIDSLAEAERFILNKN